MILRDVLDGFEMKYQLNKETMGYDDPLGLTRPKLQSQLSDKSNKRDCFRWNFKST